jgi:hypothetical protein
MRECTEVDQMEFSRRRKREKRKSRGTRFVCDRRREEEVRDDRTKKALFKSHVYRSMLVAPSVIHDNDSQTERQPATPLPHPAKNQELQLFGKTSILIP